MGDNAIPASELRHTIIVLERTAGSADEYGQPSYTTVERTYKCHFEFIVTTEPKEDEQSTQYDVLVFLLPTATAKKGDQIKKVTTKNGEVVYDLDNANPIVLDQVDKIPYDEGIHHIEAYGKYQNPQS